MPMTKTISSTLALLAAFATHAAAVEFVHQPNFQWSDPPGRYYDADCLVATPQDVRTQNPEIPRRAVRRLFGRRGQRLHICQVADDALDIVMYVTTSDERPTGHAFGWAMDQAPNIAGTHCIHFLQRRKGE